MITKRNPKAAHGRGGPRKRPKNPNHNLKRYERSSAAAVSAWRVTIKRRNEVVCTYFTDSRYGGKAAAHAAAIAFRDATLARLSDGDYAAWRRNRGQQRGKTGIVGVGRYSRIRNRRGKKVEEPYWQAFWHDADGKRHTASFSSWEYGEARAKTLAIGVRRRAMKEVRETLLQRKFIYGVRSAQ